MLGEEGYGLTVAARRPEKLEAAAEGLRAKGYDVNASPATSATRTRRRRRSSRSHHERFGRLDVLVNNAGVGIGEAVADLTTKKIDIQLDTNLRSIFLFYREACRAAARGGRGAPQRARRQHVVDLGQARRGVAVGLLARPSAASSASPRR